MRNLLCGMAAVLLSMVFVCFPPSPAKGRNTRSATSSIRAKPFAGKCEHRSMVRATVSRHTQTTETLSTSVNAVAGRQAFEPDGTATFEHRVEWVDMRQKLTGRDEVHYDSRTDKKPPVGFEDAAKSVGVPLAVVKMDVRGKVLHRKDRKQEVTGRGRVARVARGRTRLDHDSVARASRWPSATPGRSRRTSTFRLPSGAIKKIKAVQRFVLEDVKTGVATIRVSTEILTPITDPAVESQLVQREAAGRVRFDIDAGRILGQQMDIDKHVVGFRGDASSIHYVNRFSERLLPEPGRR